MQSADRGQYEVLKDDDVSVTPGPSGVLQSNTLRLDETHNLDAFFSNIYQTTSQAALLWFSPVASSRRSSLPSYSSASSN
ncbi:hypothetical protein AAHC03_02023 [Spirometra sp. Aus1]